MAIWENRIVYQNGDRFWENVWNIDVGSADDVPPAVTLALQAFGLGTLLDLYSVARIVRRPAGTHDEFIEVIVDALGHIESGSFKPLPLFNTIRLLLGVGAGRPGVKFLRGALLGANIVDDENHIDPTFVSYIRAQADTLFNALSDASCFAVVGATDKPSVNPEVDPLIQMRQQHRKRKKTV